MAGARVLEGRPIANRIRDDVFERAKSLRQVAIVPNCSTFVGEGDKEGAFYAESLRKVGTRLGVEVSVHIMSLADGTRGFVNAITDAVHGVLPWIKLYW